jgi:hypothetical protein
MPYMKNRLSIFVLAITLLSAALGAAAQEYNRRLTISGQLLDAEFREPMMQATVQLFTTTDSTFVGGTVRTVLSPSTASR